MEGIEQARSLLMKQRYREAASLLDRLLPRDADNDELWYLRGMASLKMKNYDAAQECFGRALLLGRKSRYYQIKGMAHFEVFEMEEALDAFLEASALEPDDPTTNFFLAMCYLFLDDPRSDAYIRKAYDLNKKKTKQLLLNFYTLFLRDDPRINEAQRNAIESHIRSLKA
ncbi:tetratricopeptide repeat protein [Candidatus Micrarchaeota archaeon]|nr:tetratricopeptide repeat protein [Candidatus Micrarchaeota archaeon]